MVFLAQRPRSWPAFPFERPQEALTALGHDRNDVFVISRKKPNGFFGIPNVFVEEELGVRATTRNWSTITRIVERFAGS